MTYYCIQLICSPIPSSVPTGYSSPSPGFNYNNGTNYGFPNTGYTYTPRVVISSTNNFYKLVGFSAGTYPSSISTASASILGSITPNLTPVNSLILLCNLVRNGVSSQSNILTSIPISNTTFGNNLNFIPNFEQWVSITPGSYSSFTLSIVDQNFNFVEENDPNLLITISLEIPDDLTQKSAKDLISINKLYTH